MPKKYPKTIKKPKKALKLALDIRKFEIELYWKRAAYFWTLIAAVFAGYFLLATEEKVESKEYYLTIVSCIGIVLSWSWFLANKGSKFWQENWEAHVDALEDKVLGPLYKTILKNDKGGWNWLTGAGNFSVSKINQIVSFFVLVVWVILLLSGLATYAPEFGNWLAACPNLGIVAFILLSVSACAGIFFCGRSGEIGHQLRQARTRNPEIKQE